MSFVMAQPEVVTAAAGQLTGIGSSLGAAAEAAATPTTGIAAAAADEISLAISRLFGAYGQEFQAVNAQAAAFQAEFVRALNGGAAAYVSAEIANAERTLLGGALAGGLPIAAPAEPIGDFLGGLLGGGTTGGTTTTGGGGLGGLLGGLITLPGGPGLLGPATLTNVLVGATGGAGPLGPILTNLGNSLQNLFFPPPADPAVGPYPSPYQTLFENTSRNLGALGANYRPFPVLNQISVNQGHYAQMALQAAALNLQGFPANLPANITNFLASGNPANLTAGIEQFVNGTSGFYGILGHQLQEVGAGLQQTFPTFQRDLDLAGIAINQGHYDEAVEYGARSFIDLFITGFDTSGLRITPDFSNLLAPEIVISGPVGLEGPAGALLPILTALGDQATGTASTFPANSWLGGTMRNFANGIGVLADGSVSADFAVTLDLNILENPGLTIGGEAMFGLPLQLGFAVLGSPFAAFGGLAEGSTAFGTAVVNGNLLGAANAIGNMPAYILDGFLNGEVIIDQPLPVTVPIAPGVPIIGGLTVTIPTIAGLPMAGLLVDPHGISATVPLSQVFGVPGLPEITVPLGGTKFGGLLPFLLNTMPQDIAGAMSYQNSE